MGSEENHKEEREKVVEGAGDAMGYEISKHGHESGQLEFIAAMEQSKLELWVIDKEVDNCTEGSYLPSSTAD